MSMDQLCVLAVWFTNVLILVSLIFVLVNINKSIKKKEEIEQLRMNFDFEPKESDFVIIDNLIQENMIQYRVLKLENIDKLYITDQIQKKIFEYVLRQTLYQISPIYMQRLSYIYNKEKLDEIITQKINMSIMEYTIEVNGNALGQGQNK